jgi:hypothetical protein
MCLRHQYGVYPSWRDATKALGQVLAYYPDNVPVQVWVIAAVILGEAHPQWTKDMVRQFVHLDALEIAVQGDSIREDRYFVHADVIDELGLY